MKYEIKHFNITEFGCRCCGKVEISTSLIFCLEMLRRAWGLPIIVNSGFRCEKHNKEVGGASSSRHKIGCAADIRPHDKTLLPAFKNLTAYLFGDLKGWEYIEYPTFVHVAVPREETKTLWSGGNLKIIITS